MSQVTIQVYPTLLNDWARFQAGNMEEDELLGRINRLPVVKTPEQMAGIAFEEALLSHLSGNLVEDYNVQVLDEMGTFLPSYAVTQQFVEFTHKHIRFYGKADVVGEGRVIDIKTTGSYAEPRYMRSYQNLYLYALLGQCKTMEYLITDFRNVYREVYHAESYDFRDLLMGMEEFADFCHTNKNLITDPKIFSVN